MSIHEECGVFGVFSDHPVDAAKLSYYGLYALQHRGQESCGIVINDDGVFTSHKDIGLVSEVFTKDILLSLPEGSLALGAGKWYMIRTVVLPSAIDGIVTGCILSVGRIVGESAALLFTAGMANEILNLKDAVLPGNAGSTLTVSLYMYAKERGEFEIAFAIAAILLVLTFIINMSAKMAAKILKKGRG